MGPRLTRGLSRNVLILGAVSFFTDISSEMLVPIRILFLVFTLGTPLPIAGLIEGIAESASSLLKVVAGRLADRVAQRKPLILTGYGLSNLAKPLLAFVTIWPAALGLIVVDRIGKGIRGAPRDTLLAESTPPGYRGKAFGFHRSMDTAGAAIGPLLTALILTFSGYDLRPVFAWTIVPGVLGLLVLIIFLREKRRERPAPQAHESVTVPRVGSRMVEWRRQAVTLGTAFWGFTAISTVFALGNSSDAFIFLRTQGVEHSLEAVPLVYFGYNVVYALLATPLGVLSDRFGRAPVLIGGYITYGLVYEGWALTTQTWGPWVLFLFYGVYSAATEGVGKALVTDVIPGQRRGLGLGWYNGITGFAALPANILAGWLWSQYGPSLTFGVASALGFLAAALLWAYAPRQSELKEEMHPHPTTPGS